MGTRGAVSEATIVDGERVDEDMLLAAHAPVASSRSAGVGGSVRAARSRRTISFMLGRRSTSSVMQSCAWESMVAPSPLPKKHLPSGV